MTPRTDERDSAYHKPWKVDEKSKLNYNISLSLSLYIYIYVYIQYIPVIYIYRFSLPVFVLTPLPSIESGLFSKSSGQAMAWKGLFPTVIVLLVYIFLIIILSFDLFLGWGLWRVAGKEEKCLNPRWDESRRRQAANAKHAVGSLSSSRANNADDVPVPHWHFRRPLKIQTGTLEGCLPREMNAQQGPFLLYREEPPKAEEWLKFLHTFEESVILAVVVSRLFLSAVWICKYFRRSRSMFI